ncbi:MAG: CRISPR-associated endonuclease Cas1 [Ruminococcus sp.]
MRLPAFILVFLMSLILQQKKIFLSSGRSKRPPMDNVKCDACHLFIHLLTNQIASALEAVGLDPYVGYLHTERHGQSVTWLLDLIEEFRAVYADRFVVSLINKKIVNGKIFHCKENGAVLMDDDLRKKY